MARHGLCVRCGECCRPDPSVNGNPAFSAEELDAPDRVEGYCPMFRWVDGVGHCLGHGWHPFYLIGCHLHPQAPGDLADTPSCSYTFD